MPLGEFVGSRWKPGEQLGKVVTKTCIVGYRRANNMSSVHPALSIATKPWKTDKRCQPKITIARVLTILTSLSHGPVDLKNKHFMMISLNQVKNVKLKLTHITSKLEVEVLRSCRVKAW